MATLAVAVIAGAWTGWQGALSAVLGGVVNIAAGVVFAVLDCTEPDRNRDRDRAYDAAGRGGERSPVIVLQLWLVLTMYKDVVHAAFFAAFVVTVLVSQAAILVKD